MLRFAPGVMGGPSVDEWLLETLSGRGPKTLDKLGRCLPETNWAQLLLAIDRLSRRVDMRLHSHGEYLISLNPPAEFTPESVTA